MFSSYCAGVTVTLISLILPVVGAVKTLLLSWRNFRPIWEYDSPLTKSMLRLTGEAPYVRFRTGLDGLRLFGPSEYYFQVDADNTLHSVGAFSDADVL